MLPSPLLAVAAVFAAGVAAQSTTLSSSPSSTSDSAVTTVSIAVGADGYKFTPNEIQNVPVGSILEFSIYPGGHAVARSDFEQPCIPYALTGANHVGFYSGNISPQVISDNLPKYSVRVNDTAPIFFYCTAPTSCIKQHMIGVVNPNATWTFDIQEQFVNNATLQLTPGENWPQEGASTTASVPAATGSSSSSGSSSSEGSSLGAGQIAGIAIGGAAVVILAAALIYLCGRRGGIDKAYRRSTQTFAAPPMTENYGGNPKSPGQATFTTNHYSLPADQDPYRSQTQSPPQGSHMQHTPPPPLSPHNSGYNTYPGGVAPGVHSPLMGEMQGQQGYYMPVAGAAVPEQAHHAPPPPPQAAPVELPTSSDPGHSPLPKYQRTFSWSQGAEGQYRPGKP